MLTEKVKARLHIISTIALVLAVLLLCAAIPGIIPLISGRSQPTDVSELTRGKFVRIEVTNIQAIYGEEFSAKNPDKVTRLLAVTKLGDRMMTLSLPERYFDTAYEMLKITEESNAYGFANTKSFLVDGTIAQIDADTQALLSDWFSNNYSSLALYGVIPADDCDYGNLSGAALKADYVGGYPSFRVLFIDLGVTIIMLAAAFALQHIAYDKPRVKAIAEGVSEEIPEAISDESPDELPAESSAETTDEADA